MAGELTRRPDLHVALLEPEIAGNAGAIARLCAATGSRLHLIGRLGFHLTGPAARRAGMDYWSRAEPVRHVTLADFLAAPPGRVRSFSTRGERSLWEVDLAAGDTLLFGSESRGLPDDALHEKRGASVRIPMHEGIRSLNLATAVGIALYEALRQVDWVPAGGPGPR